MTILRSPDPEAKPRKRATRPALEVDEDRPIEISRAVRAVPARREPRPHFPHLVRPRPACFVLPVDAV